MPATSSAPGSQPESVAKRNAKRATTAAVKAVAKSTAKAVTTSTAITQTATQTARAISSAPAATAKTSRSRSGRSSRPEPALRPYKAPKPIAEKVKSDLKAIDKPEPRRAARRPILVAPKLEDQTIKVRPKRTLISTDIAKRAKQALPKQQQQKIQKQPAPKKENPKVQGPKEKAVARKLKKAVRRSQPKVAQVPEMGNSQEVAPIVKRLAEKRGIAPSLLMGQIEQESGFNPAAVSSAGAQGETQFIPGTADAYGVQYGTSRKAVKSQLKGQANYMADLGAADNPDAALSSYLGDEPGGVDNGGPAYAAAIRSHAEKYAALDAPAGKGKPIPKAVKSQAKAILGAKKTKQIVKGKTSAPDPGPKQLDGAFSGSRTFVREIVGSKVKSDHGVENEGTVHSATGDHYDPNSYAQDINNPAGNPAEGEPAYNQATLTKIVKNLRKQGADVPDLKIGENWEGVVKGYRVQLLTNEGGEISHIHIGARWEGTPTSVGAPVSGSPALTSAPSAPGVPTTSTPTRKKRAKARKRRKSHRRTAADIRLSPLTGLPDATDYEIDPSTSSYSEYVKRAPVSLGL